MSVVSNASPLINLARIGRLDLLRLVYAEVHIPKAVWREVVAAGAGMPGADEVRSAGWIHREAVSNRQLVHALEEHLAPGEAEAIALAVERQAEVLLMDERLGRETAKHFGLAPVGLVGVVVEAKRKGIVDSVAPLLRALQEQARFWLGEELVWRVLRAEGEIF